MNEQKRINCLNCKYYYITWDQKNPKGCKYFGFKTKLMPSVMVYRTSGENCHMFQPK